VEISSVLDVRRRLGAVILGVSSAAGIALAGSNPKIRRSGVKDDVELLGRGT
jgi:hypothetical protein